MRVNDAGNTIIIGAALATVNSNAFRGYVKVYKIISGTWTLQGIKITGEAANDEFGRDVSINALGDIIAVGAASSTKSYVKVYKLISSTWTLQGIKITSGADNDRFGYKLSLNNIGDTVVIGAYMAVVNGKSECGYVKVYKLISGTWTQQGTTLQGTAMNELFGVSVSINGSGGVIAIGASGIGYAKVYELTTNVWIQMGATLQDVNNGFGGGVSLNDKGDILAVSRYSDNKVFIYKFISGAWIQQGDTLLGEAGGGEFGRSISLNNTGDTILIGAVYANSNRGYAKIYK